MVNHPSMRGHPIPKTFEYAPKPHVDMFDLKNPIGNFESGDGTCEPMIKFQSFMPGFIFETSANELETDFNLIWHHP